MDRNIRYELDGFKNGLKQEIERLQIQLSFANRKLEALKYDLFLFPGFIIVPPIIWLLCGKAIEANLGVLFKSVCVAVYIILEFAYLILLPYFLYKLSQTLVLSRLNREDDQEMWAKPKEVGPYNRRYGSISEEKSYLMEKRKLVWILSRYYLYEEKLEELYERAEREELTKESLSEELEKMPFYEEIKPANPFTPESKKRIGFTVAFGAVMIVGVAWVLLKVVQVFG